MGLAASHRRRPRVLPARGSDLAAPALAGDISKTAILCDINKYNVLFLDAASGEITLELMANYFYYGAIDREFYEKSSTCT